MSEQIGLGELAGLRVGVVGAGVMGQAMIRGLLDAGFDKSHLFAAVNTKTSVDRLRRELGIDVSIGYKREWVPKTDIFLLCTKPFRIPEILEKIRDAGGLSEHALFISIAAGTTLKRMEGILPEHAFVRAMPNTPCLIHAGATVIAAGAKTTPAQMALAKRIFEAVGICLELPEHHMNAVTAVSGSGPAYIYLMMEALADGAVKVGLPRNVAFQLVSQTMLGAALMLQKSGKHPAMLKDEVTTPAGCTISALMTLEDGKIRSTLARAVEEATRTAAGLGS